MKKHVSQKGIKQPLVSVLITCYNGLPYIKKALDCLIQQTYSNIEIIVVDDFSDDGTYEFLISNAKNNPNIFYYHNPLKGRGKALNFGLSKCKGKYVAINDADDLSLPERIEKQVDFLENNPDYGIVGSMSKLVSLEDERIIKESDKRPVTNEEIRICFTKGQPMQHVTVMFSKDLILSLGGYNEKIDFLFDRDLFLRIAQVSKMYNLEDILVNVGEHENRYFKYKYKGIVRNWYSMKYQISAIITLGYSPFRIIPVLLRFIYSLFLAIKRLIFNNV